MSGVTLIEMIIVIAIIGILAAIGFSSLNRDRFQVQQAARSYLVSIQKARYEAISRNRFAGVRLASPGYQIFASDDSIYSSDDLIVSSVAVGSGDYSLVQLSSNVSNSTIVFDPRGVIVTSPIQTLTFQSKSNASYTVKAVVSTQGRVRLE